MKKLLALILAAALMLPVLSAMAATEFDVTEPITIEWWHAHESQFDEQINYMVNKFNEENGMGITVVPVYKGAYADIDTEFRAADAAEKVPALVCCNTSYPAAYGAAGLCEVLDPYIEAFDYDVEDFGEGLLASTSYDDEQICLPYLISTQCMYYNKTAAEAEGIEMPKTFDDMEAFLEKATLFNEDGTTKRYGTVFGGWDYWYHEMLFKNNGVQIVTDEGTTDVNSEKSIELNTKIKEWIDKGYAYYAIGSGASSNMRDLFIAGGAFSVFHTSSLYTTYVNRVNALEDESARFEVGMAWLPGGSDGESFKSEVGGAAIFIPAKWPAPKSTCTGLTTPATCPPAAALWICPSIRNTWPRSPQWIPSSRWRAGSTPATRTPLTTTAAICGVKPWARSTTITPPSKRP